MKKIMILNGAAKKCGNTAELIQAFTEGAKEAGNEVKEFYLQGMNIHGCLDCQGCKELKPGMDSPCVQHDDMDEIYHTFADTDVIVFASPIYWWSVSGPLKTTTDRLYGLFRNSSNSQYTKKESALLLTAGGPDYSQPLAWYEGFERYLGWKNLGEVCGIGKVEEAKALGAGIA